MKLVLDAGALLALERNDRTMWLRLKAAHRDRRDVVAHGGILAQAWRGAGPREALLSRALGGIEILPLDRALGRAAGELLARTHGSDAIDAALVLLADDDDHILTSDPEDITPLAEATGRHVEIILV